MIGYVLLAVLCLIIAIARYQVAREYRRLDEYDNAVRPKATDEEQVCAPYGPKVTPEKLAREALYGRPQASIIIYPHREKP